MNHIAQVRSAFAKQATSFNDSRHTIGSAEIMDWIIQTISPLPDQCVLDVATGTGLLGRSLAKIVKQVTAIDVTETMLDVAKAAASGEGLKNLEFLNAEAEKMPFSDHEFDLVVSRLAVHHFLEPQKVVFEMCRVCKGRIFVIDLISPDELQQTYNDLERLRDPSHTQALTVEHLLQLFKDPILRDIREVEVDFDKWVQLTQTAPVEKIRQILQAEIDGGSPTGFQPRLVDGKIKFHQRWAIVEAKCQ